MKFSLAFVALALALIAMAAISVVCAAQLGRLAYATGPGGAGGGVGPQLVGGSSPDGSGGGLGRSIE